MPTSTLPLPAAARPMSRPGARRRRSAPTAAAVAIVRTLTVLVGLATAAITLGPRWLVVAGMGFAQQWLAAHPSLNGVVAALGGVEAAGNVVLFVPFATLLALAVSLRFLPVAFLALACAPFAVEWAQRYLPGRVPDGNDIVRNTIGLLVAFCAVAAVRLALGAVLWVVRRF